MQGGVSTLSSPKTGNKRQAQLLISGGIDSTACLAFLISNNFDVKGTFIDFGQPARKRELVAARKITKFYDISLQLLQVIHTREIRAGEISGRNGFLIFAGLITCLPSINAICIGVHAGTPYSDCSKSFITQIDTIVAEITDGATRVFAPFVDWDKNQIVHFAKIQRVPLELTYSCEAGNTPCGVCASCEDREHLKC